MAQRKNNSFKSVVINYIWLCIIAGAVLAFININGGSSDNLIDKVFVTSNKVGAWYKKCFDSDLKDYYQPFKICTNKPSESIQFEINYISSSGKKYNYHI